MKAHIRGSYIQKTYIAGATIEIMKTYSTRYGKKLPREKNQKPSPEAVAKYNEKLAEDTLRRLINENFTYRDYHLVLTYGTGKCPEPPEAKKQLARFLRRLRAEYRKRGAELKYVAVTEYKGKRIHHHLVINRLDDGLFAECWGYGRPHITPLDATGDYAALAHYLIKETGRTYKDKEGFSKRWSGSKNLSKVEPFVAVIPARAWRKKPEVPKKWRNEYILVEDSVRAGVSEITGYEYQSFRLVRIDGARGRPVSQSTARRESDE